jgi:hypothetical protein
LTDRVTVLQRPTIALGIESLSLVASKIKVDQATLFV